MNVWCLFYHQTFVGAFTVVFVFYLVIVIVFIRLYLFPSYVSKVHPLRPACCPAQLCLKLQLCRGKAAWSQQQGCGSQPNLHPPHHCVCLRIATGPSETLRQVFKAKHSRLMVACYRMSSYSSLPCTSLCAFDSGDSSSGGSLAATLQTQPSTLLRARWEPRTGAQEAERSWGSFHQPPAAGASTYCMFERSIGVWAAVLHFLHVCLMSPAAGFANPLEHRPRTSQLSLQPPLSSRTPPLPQWQSA